MGTPICSPLPLWSKEILSRVSTGLRKKETLVENYDEGLSLI